MCEIGGVNVDVEAKSKEQQADYLLEAMRQLDEETWSKEWIKSHAVWGWGKSMDMLLYRFGWIETIAWLHLRLGEVLFLFYYFDDFCQLAWNSLGMQRGKESLVLEMLEWAFVEASWMWESHIWTLRMARCKLSTKQTLVGWLIYYIYIMYIYIYVQWIMRSPYITLYSYSEICWNPSFATKLATKHPVA